MPAIATYASRAIAFASGFAVAATVAGSACAAEFATLTPLPAPSALPFEAKSLDGSPLSIATDPARVTLVHFFASWCEPCEEEMPALARFARAEAASVRLIGVAVAEPASRAGKFAARFDLPGEIASDPDKTVAAAFAVRGLPATVALAPDGRALAAPGPLDWTSPEVAAAVSGLKNKP